MPPKRDPAVDLCQFCGKKVETTTAALDCDSCGRWNCQECLNSQVPGSLPDQLYQALQQLGSFRYVCLACNDSQCLPQQLVAMERSEKGRKDAVSKLRSLGISSSVLDFTPSAIQASIVPLPATGGAYATLTPVMTTTTSATTATTTVASHASAPIATAGWNPSPGLPSSMPAPTSEDPFIPAAFPTAPPTGNDDTAATAQAAVQDAQDRLQTALQAEDRARHAHGEAERLIQKLAAQRDLLAQERAAHLALLATADKSPAHASPLQPTASQADPNVGEVNSLLLYLHQEQDRQRREQREFMASQQDVMMQQQMEQQRVLGEQQRLLADLVTRQADNAAAAEERRKAREAFSLPKAQNERFSGLAHKWPAFWSSFDARIHSNPNISLQLKMELLVDALKGGTAAVKIEGMATLGENYEAAVAKLKSHFGSDLALQEAVWKELYGLAPVKANMSTYEYTVDALSCKVDTLRACKVLEPALDQYAFQWLQHQPNELNNELLRLRIANNTANQPWKMKELLDALNNLMPLYRSRQVRDKGKSNSANQASSKNSKSSSNANSSGPAEMLTLLQPPQKKDKSVPKDKAATASSSPDKTSSSRGGWARAYCHICEKEDNHRAGSTKCPLTPTSGALKSLVIKHKRCTNCLYLHSNLKACPSKFSCAVCSERHHTLLHDEYGSRKDKKQLQFASPSNLSLESPQTQEGQTPNLMVQDTESLDSVTLCTGENLLEPSLLASPTSPPEVSKSLAHRLPQLAINTRTKMLAMPVRVHSTTNDSPVKCTLFLDGGSEFNYIRRDLAEELGLQPQGFKHNLTSSFGSSQIGRKCNWWVEFVFEGPSGQRMDVGAFVVEDICADFVQKPTVLSDKDKATADLYKVVNIDNIQESKRTKVSILLGMIDHNAIVFAYDDCHVRLEGGLRIILTPFGNLLCGSKRGSKGAAQALCRRSSHLSNSASLNSLSADYSDIPSLFNEEDQEELKHDFTPPDDNVYELLHKLFKMHAAGIEDEDTKVTLNSKNHEIMQQFLATLHLTDSGKYECGFLWKMPQPDLPNNLLRACARLGQIVRRFHQNGEQDKLLLIDKIFKEYLDKDMLEVVDHKFVIDKKRVNERASGKTTLLYYVSHFPVMKATAVTTKCRVVLDGSEKVGSSKTSLNDQMHKGENLMTTLIGVLLRSRLTPLLLTFDCEKAYLSIGLRKADQDSCRILWLRDPTLNTLEDNLIVLRFRVIVFGLVCSSFILHATFSVLLQNAHNRRIANRVLGQYYCDNFSLGCQNLGDALDIFHGVRDMFGKRGFNQRSWASNCKEFNDQLEPSVRHPDLEKKEVDLLGLKWDFNLDILRAKSQSNLKLPSVITKRVVAAVIAKLGYDTLGLSIGTVMLGRLFMGELWKSGYDWDSELSQEETVEFQEIFQQLSLLSTISWPRLVLPFPSGELCLLAFSDASERGICSSVYLWNRSGSDISSNLLMSKAKIVNPKPARTIVQLELNAAVMGTRLLLCVKEELSGLSFQSCHLFCDSTIVLCFLKGDKKLPKYTQHRVDEINSAGLHLHHIPGVENPSDFGTRGVPASVLRESLWRHGPPLVCEKGPEEWIEFQPSSEDSHSSLSSLPLPLLLAITDYNVHEPPAGIDITRFSSLRALISTTCWTLRFALRSLRTQAVADAGGTLSYLGPPTVEERKAALLLWLLSEQKACYGAEIHALNAGKTTQLQLQLDLVLDEQGLLKCGGRLQNSALALSAVHPILLGKKRDFTKLVVLDAHANVFHKKSTYTLNEVRRQFWIPQGMSFVRHTLKLHCSLCRLITGSPLAPPPMGRLPSERLLGKRCYEFSAMDHFGPINVRINGHVSQIYVLLLCCLTTRAVSLEYTLSTSADATVDALRRFFARNGVSRVIYSDSATGFVKTAEMMKKGQQSVPDFLAHKLVQFKRNPPSSPWVGGVFERLIGVCKSMLRSVFWRKIVELETFRTVLIEAEGALNTRPLCSLSSELGDGQVLCPANFIAPSNMLGVKLGTEPLDDPDFRLKSTRETLTNHYKQVSRLTQAAFAYLQQHYIPNLRAAHTRFFRGQRKEADWGPKVGSVYLLLEKDKDRQLWKRCKVLKRLPGLDGKVRFCQVLLSSGQTSTRGIRTMVPLEGEFVHELMDDDVSDADGHPGQDDEGHEDDGEDAQGAEEQATQPRHPPPPHPRPHHPYFTRSKADKAVALLHSHSSTPQPRPSSLPPTLKTNNHNWLHLLLLLLSLTSTFPSSQAFQICSHGPGGKSLRLPEQEPECVLHPPRGHHSMVNVSLWVPSNAYPSTRAWACYLETTSVCTETSWLWTSTTLSPTVSRSSVSPSLCRSVNNTRLHQNTPLARSKRFPAMLSSNISLQPEYGWAKSVCSSVTNFVLLEGEVTTKDAETASTSFSFHSTCAILSGVCESEELVIIWTPLVFVRFCPFRFGGNYTAQRNGEILTIPQLQASFVLSQDVAPDCLPSDSSLTKEGAAILSHSLHPHHQSRLRQRSHLHGLAVDAMHTLAQDQELIQIKLWLNFLEEEMKEEMERLMLVQHLEYCEKSRMEQRRNYHLLRLHPTAGVRFLLSREDVTAHWLEDFLVVHLCHQVNHTRIFGDHQTPGLAPGRCWDLVPVQLQDQSIWFLAPGTKDLVPHSNLVPCHSIITRNSYNISDNFTLPHNVMSSKIAWNVSEGPLIPFTSGPIFRSVVALPPSVEAMAAQRYPGLQNQVDGVIAHLGSVSPWSSGDIISKGLTALKDSVVDLTHNAVWAFDNVVNSTVSGSVALIHGGSQAVHEDLLSPLGNIVEGVTYFMVFLFLSISCAALCWLSRGCKPLRDKIGERRRHQQDQGDVVSEQHQARVFSQLQLPASSPPKAKKKYRNKHRNKKEPVPAIV